MTRLFSTLLLLLLAAVTFAQGPTFKGAAMKTGGDFEALAEQFYTWQVYQIDAQAFDSYVKNAGQDVAFDLQLGTQHDWNLHIEPRDLRSANYAFRTSSDDGVQLRSANGENLTYRGHIETAGGGTVALTIDEDFIYGYFEMNGETWWIEPLWYFVPNQPKDRFVVYASSNVKPTPNKTCGYDEMLEMMGKQPVEKDHHDHGEMRMMGCKEVELAIASDYSMFQKYGSQNGVEAHNIGVINNMQTNYDDEFNDMLLFIVVEQFVVTTSGGDPWTTSTDASTLLTSFRNWGPSGFNATHDLGELWTNRNLDGGTVGIAYLNAVCTSNRYHVLQDFTTNSNFLRVLCSHEIGHNFSATHDPSGSNTIMAPAVNNTNTWSNQSLNQINNYYPTRTCLANCPGAQPPTADFTVSPSSGCAPLTVTYMDQSSFASTWAWSFPGGTPASSTQQNPTVTYNTPGSYNATLTVTNPVGSNTITKNNIVTVNSVPVPSFNFTQVGLTMVFENTSTNANSYLWDFGDNTTSTEVNPVHTYSNSGFYNVTLTATNACGSSPISLNLPVFLAPVADFTANPTSGCAALDVNFSDASTNTALTWLWEFEGGSPSASNQQHPSVTFTAPGTYNVTLTVTNPAGTDSETKIDYITVGTIPIPGFTFVTNGSTVTFTNTTNNSNGIGTTTYSWNFGDNTTSTETNPVHTYTGNGNFTVTLTATNTCGNSAVSHVVNIIVPPTAGFSADDTQGCAPFTVQFNNESSDNSDSFEWTFPGGAPGTSTAENPEVVYNTPGTYDVTLTVTNSAGSNTVTLEDYISVGAFAAPSFTSSVSGFTATFTNTSTNATSYSWDFGDSNTSTETNPAHTYAMDGVYTVTLTATNDCGPVTTTQTVTIVTPPSAGFSANNTEGCAPLTVQFNNESSDNSATFEWEFPGGDPSTSTAENPSVTYDSPGSYTVTLTVTNSAGTSTHTETNYITVNTVPVAGFTSATNGFDVDFTNTSTNATSYSWGFGDSNSSTDENPSHTYAMDGEYDVALTATNECGSVTSTQTVTIVTPPSAGFSANSTEGCAPLTVQFTNESSENATSFEWEFPGGDPSSSTDESPSVTYNEAGSYSVTLTAFNAAGESTVTETNFIVVTDVPAPSFTVSTNVFVANFTNTTLGGTSFEWEFGDGGTSTDENPTHEYPGDGTYTVTLTVTNDCGTGTLTQDVEITSLPQAGFSAAQTQGCTPFVVQFQDQSSSNVEAWEWEFPGGNPSSSTEQNPSVTYPSVGTYSVTLTVTNSLGESTATQMNYIVVNTAPSAGFTSTTNLLTADFTNTSSGATSYDWDFGDSNTSAETDPSHTYAMDGVYTVTLTATNDCGTETFTQEVTVVSLPTAGFSAAQTQGCAPFVVAFTNESSENATTFEWEFPGGTPNTSTAENPTVTYNMAGVYNVTLTASNAAGEDVFTQTNYITVGAKPVASFTTTLNLLTATFTNNSTNPANSGTVSYDWDFGDGETSTDVNPVHTYAEDGTYEVTLSVTNDCGTTVINGQITVVSLPSANFSAGQTMGCAPFQVQFNNESSNNAEQFEWEFPGGTPATSTVENPLVTYSAAGVYSVTLTVTNVAGSDSHTLIEYIAVDAAPSVNFDHSVNTSTVTFTNLSNNATSFEWDFGDGETSMQVDPVHTYAQDGIYNVTLTATNDCGSTIYEDIVVIATSGPLAAFTTEHTQGCAPFEVTFENQSSDNSETFEWSFPGGTPSTSTEEEPTVTYSTSGVYDVTLTVTNGLGSDTHTEPAYIVVEDVPVASFTAVANLGNVAFTNTSTGGTSFEWDFGDGETSTDENPVHTYAEDGEYTVTLTAQNDCGFASNTQTVNIMLTGVDEIPGITAFNVYPNPNNGHFTLSLQGEGRLELEIYFTNVLGQVILNQTVNFSAGQLTQDFSFDDLAAGMYLFQVRSGDQSLHRKVVVE